MFEQYEWQYLQICATKNKMILNKIFPEKYGISVSTMKYIKHTFFTNKRFKNVPFEICTYCIYKFNLQFYPLTNFFVGNFRFTLSTKKIVKLEGGAERTRLAFSYWLNQQFYCSELLIFYPSFRKKYLVIQKCW